MSNNYSNKYLKYKNKYLKLNNKLIGGGQISILSFNGSVLFNMNESDKLSDLLKKIIIDKQTILFKLVVDTQIIDLSSNLNKSLENICDINKQINLVFVSDMNLLNNLNLSIYKLLFSDNINVFNNILRNHTIPYNFITDINNINNIMINEDNNPNLEVIYNNLMNQIELVEEVD
jgi:hypothetical protein